MNRIVGRNDDTWQPWQPISAGHQEASVCGLTSGLNLIANDPALKDETLRSRYQDFPHASRMRTREG